MMLWVVLSALVAAAVAAPQVTITAPKACNVDPKLMNEIASYGPVVDQIIDAVMTGPHKKGTWNSLANFVDKFGNRISGSQNLENAIDYMLQSSKDAGLDNVHGELVNVTHWVRGSESASLLEPLKKPLAMLGLGGSVATPPEGITAEVFVVSTFEELSKNQDKAKGKIVVFNEEWVGYGETVKYRQYAASAGAKAGAVATLVRSIAPFSINSPHTGWQDYDAGVKQIPTACITIEDAAMLQRMQQRGDKIVIQMKMEAKTLDPAISRNTVVEIEGKADKNKVVILSGHLDSWDVGMGAMDDGGGAFISWYSLVLLKSLGLQPKRTLRTILWTGEEEGLIGASAYKAAHAKEQDNFVLLMESDIGTFTPQGITFGGSEQAGCIVQEILKLFGRLNATQYESSSDVGSDIMVWAGEGIPLASLKNEDDKYFWFHHSNGDTMALEDPDVLDKCTALWAATAYIVADLSVTLPR